MLSQVSEGSETPLREQVRRWKEDEREKMKQEQERSKPMVDEDGSGRHLDHLREGELNPLMGERPSGLSHVVVEGGAAQELERWDLSTQDRGSWKLVESRPCLEVNF
jgi:hypothetical protein